MLTTTTSTIEGHSIDQYIGVITAETIIGANFIRDIMASFSDFFGGRSGAYEEALQKARNMALEELIDKANRLQANGVIGIDFDYETVGRGMLMVCVSGTAVKLRS
ncbi:MAG TPA: YbjQ family protein [Luteibaculaceae bacterium]|nr:YbjQ family protein [Luteibaculaceae bacterium]